MRKLIIVTLLLLSLPAAASAQNARARVSRGGVDGVEMSLEGGLVAPRGGTLRWLVTVYEVLGLSDLRPAADATIHVATSLARTADAAEIHTDALGRARVQLPIPDDAPNSFRAVIRIVSHDGIQRRYELSVRVGSPERIMVQIARSRVSPDGPLRAFGRLFDLGTGRGLAGKTLHLTLRDQQNRPLDAAAEVVTDAAGLFAHEFRVPEEVRGQVSVQARTDDDEHPVTASATTTVSDPQHPALLVAIAPERHLVRPRDQQYIDVVVRTPHGRPLEGTVVTLDSAPRRADGRRAVTDARGRARLSWRAGNHSSGIHDTQLRVSAAREGWGTGAGITTVRVAADAHAASLAVEGGALSPTIGGRVYVRVVNPDGRPAPAGVAVRADGPRLPANGVGATTDAAGVATLDITLRPSGGATADRCGGETATAIDVHVGTTQITTCLTLDPDAAARVRVGSPVVRAGSPLVVTVDRVSGARRLPVEVSLLAANGPSAVASVILQPGETTATIPIPEDIGGLVWVRARPLVGNAREVVRGGITGVWVTSSAPMTVSAELTESGGAEIGFGGAAVGERSAYVVATPIDDARWLADRLRATALGPLGDLRTPLGDASDALLSAAISAETPTDGSAPAVLRGNRTVASPAPTNPEAAGLLRDPWRSRARFVTGRLALIFRALEQYVGGAVPDRIDDVAVRGARGFTFNAQILESVAASGQLGAAGATGLGGDPLTIEQLQRFDRTLTYDNVARRITRHRLFRLILALRGFVAARGFDLPWSRLGDPSEWMRQLVNQHAPHVGRITQRDMVDGWGRPFELRSTRAGRARFSFVDPLGSWEVVSSGADGRFGGRDDLWDPTGRVLRSGTPYAEAVGEDMLVARLEGVELGRASIELLQSAEPRAAVGGVPHRSAEPGRQRARQDWNRLPTILRPPEDPLGLRRPAHPGNGAGGVIERVDPAGARIAVTLDQEPRTWGVVVYAWTDAGYGAVALASTLAGAPLIVEAELPSRLRAGEAVELDAIVTNVRDETLPMTLTTSGDGVEIGAPDELTIRGGEAREVTLRLSPEPTVGRGEARVDFLRDGAAVRSVRWTIARVSGDHPLRLRAAGLVRGRPWQVRFETPADARRAAGRVVVLAPSALAADPDLADARQRDPALVAFSDALAGRASDPDLWATLLLRQQPNGLVRGQDPGSISMISSACAAVAWAGADEHDVDARAALQRLRAGMASQGGATGNDPSPEGIQMAAATLGALAAGGVPELTDAEQRALDPLTRIAAVIRVAMRRTIRNYPEEPTLLARAAAALLLADPRDAYGLAMLERAARHLEDAADGGARVVSPEDPDELDSLAATSALAVAAHQANRPALAERLLRGALGREHVALRAGGEAAFWLLASGAYGVLGPDAEAVDVVVDGRRQRVSLESGRAVVPLTPSVGGHEVRVESSEGAAFVRVEAVMERPFVARAAGPFALSIEGDVGDTATGAGLELALRATRATGPAILEVQLPAGIEADEPLRTSIRQATGVVRVEAREPGFLRIWLAPIGDGVELAIPLLLRWTVRGDLRGLGVVGYELGTPGQMSSIAPRGLQVEPGSIP